MDRKETGTNSFLSNIYLHLFCLNFYHLIVKMVNRTLTVPFTKIYMPQEDIQKATSLGLGNDKKF